MQDLNGSMRKNTWIPIIKHLVLQLET
jgi:hypothetical protein